MATIIEFRQKEKLVNDKARFQYAIATHQCPKCGSGLKTVHECGRCGTIELLCSHCEWGMRREL